MLKFFNLSLVTLVLASGAQANMFVDRSIVEFRAGEPVQQDIRVMNRGDEQMYVQIEVLDVLNPGEESEERVAVSDVSSIGLLATPKQFALPGDGLKQVRFVSVQPPGDLEKIYRVNVTPILPPMQQDEASMVRVVVAYQLLVIVQPMHPKEDLSISRDGTRLSLQNNGNSYVLLSEGRSCDTMGACVDLPTKRLYSGNSWDIELNNNDDQVSYQMTTFNGTRSVTW